jgi:hypothetical protein
MHIRILSTIPEILYNSSLLDKYLNKLRGLSLRANYTNRATAACRRGQCQLLRIEGCRVRSSWSETGSTQPREYNCGAT